MATTQKHGIPTDREMIAIWHRDLGRVARLHERGLIGQQERDDRVAQRLQQIDALRRENETTA